MEKAVYTILYYTHISGWQSTINNVISHSINSFLQHEAHNWRRIYLPLHIASQFPFPQPMCLSVSLSKDALTSFALWNVMCNIYWDRQHSDSIKFKFTWPEKVNTPRNLLPLLKNVTTISCSNTLYSIFAYTYTQIIGFSCFLLLVWNITCQKLI